MIFLIFHCVETSNIEFDCLSFLSVIFISLVYTYDRILSVYHDLKLVFYPIIIIHHLIIGSLPMVIIGLAQACIVVTLFQEKAEFVY